MTTLDRRLFAMCAGTALALAIGVGTSTAAKAQSQADFAQLMEAMKRVEARANTMEARLAALEKENKQVKQEAAEARAESRALRQKYGTPARPAVPAALPRDTYAMATKAPPLAPAPSWDGLYWGAAFGVGFMRARDDRSSAVVGTSTPQAPPQVSTGTQTSASSSAFGEREAGGIANLYLGYNFLATPSIVLGGQVEGGVSNIRVTTGATSTVSNQTGTTTPPGGPAGTSSFTRVSTTDLGDPIDNRWMVSVLGRGGVLVDPQDLLYVIGGYTYARTEAFGTSIGLNGATIGAGWERQVAPGWTLRGEYRYSKFQSKDATQTFSSSDVGTARNGAGLVTGVQTDSAVTTQTTHISADMHSLWLGVAHYFGH